MLEKPTSGEILVNGQDVTKLSPKALRTARKKIGMIFQHFNLLWSRTVFENIAFPLEIAGVKDKGKIKAKVTELLELVGLSDKAKAYPAQLSGGQKQRVGIARALANDPEVLLCDEATSALDPQTTQSILELLLAINQKLNLTMIVITHEMGVIKKICDSVAVITDGHIVENGLVYDLFTDPKTDTSKEFIKTIVNTEIPKEILNNIKQSTQATKLIRITFLGNSAGDSVISDLVLKHGVSANILYGTMDHIKDKVFGTLAILLTGSVEKLERSLGYLQTLNLKVEVIDHE
jgi:D-methionine transport system ATP-binding protein